MKADHSHPKSGKSNRFGPAFHSALDAVVVADPNGVICDWNPSAEALLGWHRDDVLGRHIADTIVPPACRSAVENGVRRFRRRVSACVELLIRRRSGELIPVEASITSIRIDGKHVYVGFIRDLRPQFKVERDAAMLAEIVRSSRDAIIRISPTGLIETWNDAATEIYGGSGGERVGRSLYEVLGSDRRRAMRSAIKEVLQGKRVALHRYRREDAAGNEVWLGKQFSPIFGPSGQIAGISVIVRDLTQLVRTEEAERSKREAEQSNRAKSEFLSRMSHELRTPLNAILGFSQLLDLHSEDPDVHEASEQISLAGRHLLDLINEVLDIARIESGRIKVSRQQVDLSVSVDEAIDLVAHLANAHDVDVHWHPTDEAVLADADPQLVRQVLLNLLSNAIKFNHRQGTVQVEAFRLTPSRVAIKVSDTGPGIAEAALDRLFDPFDRLGAENSGIEGTGLGLTVSRRFAEAMNGSLSLAETGPEGTSFWFELVAASPSAAEASGAEPSGAEPSGPARELHLA